MLLRHVLEQEMCGGEEERKRGREGELGEGNEEQKEGAPF